MSVTENSFAENTAEDKLYICQYCGSESNTPVLSCGSWRQGFQSEYCRGRAAHRKEVLTWHDGEPEHKGQYILVEHTLVDQPFYYLIYDVRGLWFTGLYPEGYETVQELLDNVAGVYKGAEVRWRDVPL